jgi:hypothetical protein
MTEKAKEWTARVEAWERSGKSQRTFCAESGIPLGTFQWWRYRLRHDHKPSGESSFVEVALRPKDVGPSCSHESEPVVLRYGAYRVEVTRGFDQDTLAAVLDVVERRGC